MITIAVLHFVCQIPPLQLCTMARSPKAPAFQLDRSFTYRLHFLSKLTDQESLRSYPEATGLSMSDGRCLTTVGTFEPLSVNDLARHAAAK